MKTKKLFVCLLTLLFSFCLFACGGETDVRFDPASVSVKIERAGETQQPYAVIIEIKNTQIEEGTTLLDIMNVMKDERTFPFTEVNGMITELCGVENPLDYSYCWLLFTSDEELSNEQWGAFSYGGEILHSAVIGAKDLQVKSGERYVWAYQEIKDY